MGKVEKIGLPIVLKAATFLARNLHFQDSDMTQKFAGFRRGARRIRVKSIISSVALKSRNTKWLGSSMWRPGLTMTALRPRPVTVTVSGQPGSRRGRPGPGRPGPRSPPDPGSFTHYQCAWPWRRAWASALAPGPAVLCIFICIVCLFCMSFAHILYILAYFLKIYFHILHIILHNIPCICFAYLFVKVCIFICIYFPFSSSCIYFVYILRVFCIFFA